jgi:hypothetical protein
MVARPDAVPYEDVLFVAYDGTSLSVPAVVDAQWFAGLQADWHRDAPIRQARAPAAPACPATFDFHVAPPHGTGWSVPERQADGSFAMWMQARRATMRLPTACSGALALDLEVATWMSDDILRGLRVLVDDQQVAVRTETDTAGRVHLLARIHRPAGRDGASLVLEAPRTIVPTGGNRSLAVMFRRVTLAPAS